jgi:hypothetical protein
MDLARSGFAPQFAASAVRQIHENHDAPDPPSMRRLCQTLAASAADLEER